VGSNPTVTAIGNSTAKANISKFGECLMAELDLSSELEGLRKVLDSVIAVSKLDELASQIGDLENEAANPELWSDQDKAQKITSQLSRLKTKRQKITAVQDRLSDLEVLVELANSEDDASSKTEAKNELKQLTSAIDSLEVETLLNGEYDARGAIVTIRSGAGGDDATDFAEMLLRMYLRYCEKQEMKSSVLDISYAEGAGIKSAIFEVDADYAYGSLSVESGTHRLVRMSPFNAAGKRQTSFAAVEVVPLIETTDVIDIPENEIRVDVFRSSGPGGQSVNTTDSAVRITHIPTGIVVSCQNEKSQLQNKAAALRVLQSRLLAAKKLEEDAKKKELAGDVKASWGEQMRSYVLAPYQMVKDLRTEYEVNNPDAVFDGDLDGFISAALRWRKSGDK
jgi:peptide chain release factor 2